MLQVLPAHAGVILAKTMEFGGLPGITRTCGGDPGRSSEFRLIGAVLPAHAGVILAAQ